jgi:hypothetical protein
VSEILWVARLEKGLLLLEVIEPPVATAAALAVAVRIRYVAQVGNHPVRWVQ